MLARQTAVGDRIDECLSSQTVPLRQIVDDRWFTDLFFHCPHLDDAVHLVIEVVETTQDQSQAITVAWGLIAITGYGETILDYTRVPAAFDLQRIKLYPGSPKVLTFSAKSYNESTASGSLECSLYSHARLIDAVDYFPDFCIIGNRDDIPGLLLSETGPQLADPVPMSQVSSTLDEISLSFGPHAERIENLILDDINADRLYRENHAPAVKIDPMQVVERRLRKAILNSQSVIICWGAWQPFANRSQLNLNGHIQASVSLIGGPRPNPEESLCFRNLLHLYRRDDSIFTESAPKITIQFNFALDDTVSGTFVAQLEQITVWTNLQRHYGSLSRSTTQLGDSLRETPAPTRKEIPDVVAVDREAEKPSRRQESRKEDSDAALTDQEEPLPPIITKKPTPITTPILHQKIDRVIEQESPRQNLPVSYALPLKEASLNKHEVPPIRKVFFTLQFYRFQQVTTEESGRTEHDLRVGFHGLTNDRLRPSPVVDRKWGPEPPDSMPLLCLASCHLRDRAYAAIIGYSLETPETSAVHRKSSGKQSSKSSVLPGYHSGPLWLRWSAFPLAFTGNSAVRSLMRFDAGARNSRTSSHVPVVLTTPLAARVDDLLHSRTPCVVSRRLQALGDEGPDSYRIRAKPLNPT
ncbi:hypothetical protein TELCIR_17911, partial [Teladorsagia circumcincta]